MNKILLEKLRDYFFISFGAFFIASAFANFIIPLQISAGGASGMATILNLFTGIPVVTGVAAINIILLIISFFVLDRDVFYRSIYGTLLFPVFIGLLPPYCPIGLDNPLAVVVFASLIMGIGFIFVFKYRGSTGGTSIFPYFLNKYLKLPMAVGFFLTDFCVVSLNLLLGNVVGFFYGVLFIAISNVLINISQEKILMKQNVLIYTNKDIPMFDMISDHFENLPTNFFLLNKQDGLIDIIILNSDLSKLITKITQLDESAKVITNVVNIKNITLDTRYKN